MCSVGVDRGSSSRHGKSSVKCLSCSQGLGSGLHGFERLDGAQASYNAVMRTMIRDRVGVESESGLGDDVCDECVGGVEGACEDGGRLMTIIEQLRYRNRAKILRISPDNEKNMTMVESRVAE